MLCRCYYSDILVASFAHQIKSEYCGENRSVSIEVISLEQFRILEQTEKSTTPQALSHHAMFHSFFLMTEKNSATTISHSKHIIEFLNQHIILSVTLNTLWGNT